MVGHHHSHFYICKELKIKYMYCSVCKVPTITYNYNGYAATNVIIGTFWRTSEQGKKGTEPVMAAQS